jgi:hypothetical protein
LIGVVWARLLDEPIDFGKCKHPWLQRITSRDAWSK